jgi:4-hydroxybenzoate polyprenyltransferase
VKSKKKDMGELGGVSKLQSIAQLIRLPNLLIVILTQGLLRYAVMEPLLYQSASSSMSRWFDFVMLVVATLLIAAGGYVINDYFDIKIDTINKPEKLVVNRLITARGAIKLHMLLNILAILIGFYLAFRIRSITFGLIFPFISGLLWLYSAKYKRVVAWGNLIVALLSALVIFITWLFEFFWLRLNPGLFITVLPELKFVTKIFLAYGLFAFLVSLFREIIKDMEDWKGDESYGCRTLPIVAGMKVSRWIVAGLVFFTIVLLGYGQIVMYHLNWFLVFWYFLIALQFPALYLIVKLFRSTEQADFHFLSNLCKLIMFAGILSMELVSISI